MKKTAGKKELKLITLNIEGDNHLKRVVDFIKGEKPDALCLQEVFKGDVEFLEKTFKMKAIYAPNTRIVRKIGNRLAARGLWGIAIFAKEKPKEILRYYYAGRSNRIPVLAEGDQNSINRGVLAAEIAKGGANFIIATTQFTWSGGGKASPAQHRHLDKMFSVLDGIGDFVLCGDFNAPRGGEIHKRLSARYEDNVPKSVKSTIDPKLHKIKNLRFVVDGIFSTPAYKVRNVGVVGGVSDHKALVGIIVVLNLLCLTWLSTSLAKFNRIPCN